MGQLASHQLIQHSEGNASVCSLDCERALILLWCHTNTHRRQHTHFQFHTNTQAKSTLQSKRQEIVHF